MSKDNAHLLRMGIGLGTPHPVGHHQGHLWNDNI
jgi:hypothetical protein